MSNRVKQLGRFGIVGILNTIIDYGSFNILLLLTGARDGVEVGILNLCCIVLAAANSYYFNRTWTFEADQEKHGIQIRRFFIATCIGMVINSIIVVAAANLIGILQISDFMILNGGKLLGAGFSAAWNFVLYRHWVFIRSEEKPQFAGSYTPGLVSVIIPAYNETKRLPERLRKLAETLPELFPVEIIVVDDGSPDDTAGVSLNISLQYPIIRCISYRPNRGKGKAVRTGMQAAAGEYLIFTDADESFASEHIKAVVEKLVIGYPVVIGSRRTGQSKAAEGESPIRRILSQGFNFMIRAMLLPGIYDTQCGLKGFRREAGLKIFSRQRLHGFAFDVEILSLAKALGIRVYQLPVVCKHCAGSKVNQWFSPLKMGWDVLRLKLALMTNGYDLPRESIRKQEALIAGAIFCLALTVRIPWLWMVPRFIDELKEVNLAYQISLGQAWPLHNAAQDIGAMHNYILGGIFRLLGSNMYWPRLYVAVLSALTVVLIYFIGKKLFNRWVGLIAAGLLLTNGMHILVTHMAWSNSTTPFFFLLALGATIAAEQRKSGKWLTGAFFLWALALQTHSSVIIYVLAAFFYVIRPGFRKTTGIDKKWYFASAVGFIAGYFNMIYFNLVTIGGSFRWIIHKSYALEENPGFRSYLANLKNMLFELLRTVSSTYADYHYLWQYLIQPVFLLAIGMLVYGSCCAAKRKITLPIWMIIGSLMIIPIINHRYVFYLSTRYIMPAVLCALLLVSLGAVQGLKMLALRFPSRTVVATPAAVVLTGLIIAQIVPFYQYCDKLEKTNQSNYMALAVMANIKKETDHQKKIVFLDYDLPIENTPLPYLLSLNKQKFVIVSPEISGLWAIPAANARINPILAGAQGNYIAVLSSKGYQASRSALKSDKVTSISCQIVMPVKRIDRKIYFVKNLK